MHDDFHQRIESDEGRAVGPRMIIVALKQDRLTVSVAQAHVESDCCVQVCVEAVLVCMNVHVAINKKRLAMEMTSRLQMILSYNYRAMPVIFSVDCHHQFCVCKFEFTDQK